MVVFSFLIISYHHFPIKMTVLVISYGSPDAPCIVYLPLFTYKTGPFVG
jgi:hypothetical protein